MKLGTIFFTKATDDGPYAKMTEGLKSRALSVITRSSKETTQTLCPAFQSLSVTVNARMTMVGLPRKTSQVASGKRRRSLALEHDGMTSLSSTSSIQKDFQDHRNEMRALLDSYMSSLTSQFRDITREKEEHRRRIETFWRKEFPGWKRLCHRVTWQAQAVRSSCRMCRKNSRNCVTKWRTSRKG